MIDPALYEASGLMHRYSGRTVLALDQLEVRAGEVLCLVGPTGAGKSTLLRLLAGLERPSAGRLVFAGHRFDEGEPPLEVRRRLTLVFQRPLLLSGSVRANVEYGLRLRGLGRHSTGPAQAALDRLGLGALADRPARALSGGEAQLVALVRALALGPEVLLLDEPTAHLDPARVAVAEAAIGETRRQGATLVWATHNFFQARRVADRVALLLEGRLVELGTAEEFFTAPRDPRTAAFVRGEMVY